VATQTRHVDGGLQIFNRFVRLKRFLRGGKITNM
jgi:hypothetical protein